MTVLGGTNYRTSRFWRDVISKVFKFRPTRTCITGGISVSDLDAVLRNCTIPDSLRPVVAQRHGSGRVFHVSGYGSQSRLLGAGAKEA